MQRLSRCLKYTEGQLEDGGKGFSWHARDLQKIVAAKEFSSRAF